MDPEIDRHPTARGGGGLDGLAAHDLFGGRDERDHRRHPAASRALGHLGETVARDAHVRIGAEVDVRIDHAGESLASASVDDLFRRAALSYRLDGGDVAPAHFDVNVAHAFRQYRPDILDDQ